MRSAAASASVGLTGRRRTERRQALAALREAAVDRETAQVALRGLTCPRQWLALDMAVRAEWHVEGWTSVLRTDTPLALALSACDHDGRVRARAVALLSSEDELLPVLALRATDWVRSVRDAALRRVADVLDAPRTDQFQTLLAMAAALRERSRAAELVALVDATLRRFPDRLLEPTLAGVDRYARRHAVQIAIESGLMSAERLVRAAGDDPDLVVAVRCAEAAEAMTQDADALLPLLHSSFPTLRALALTRPALAGDAALCVPYLDDRARLVRETAQLGSRRAGLDPADHYRAALRDTATPSRIAGLAETGTPADARFAHQLLTHPRPAVRAEAVRTLRTFKSGDRNALLAMLHDPSPRVLRQVSRALADHTVPEDGLWPLLATDRPPATRRTAQRLLLDRGVWTRLKADLLLIEDADPAIQEVAATDVRNWLRSQHYLPPAPPELADLAESRADVLGERTVRELRLVLRVRPPAPKAPLPRRP